MAKIILKGKRLDTKDLKKLKNMGKNPNKSKGGK